MDEPAIADQPPSPAAPGVDVIDATIRAQAERLGMAPLLEAWQSDGAVVGDGVQRLLAAAQAILAREVDYFETVAAHKGTALSDFDRLVAVLYACARPKSQEDSLDMAVLRLAGDTAVHDEFAARCYLGLAALTRNNPTESAHAFAAGLQRVRNGGPARLEAVCLFELARIAINQNRFAEAVVNAELARMAWIRAGDTARAETAAVVEALARCETGQPAEASALLRPVVTRQRRDGLRAGEIDAAAVLARCIEQVARPAFELAQRGDPQAGACYDEAMALAGDTGWRFPKESDDRCLLGRALLSTGQPDAALTQFQKASTDGAAPTARALTIALLLQAQRLSESQAALIDLDAAWAADPSAFADGVKPLSQLVLQLLALGHTGWAQRLAERLPAHAAGAFETRAQVALVVATAQMMSGEHDALEAAMHTLVTDAQAQGTLAIELAARYTAAESALVRGHHAQALAAFEQLVARAEGHDAAIHAAALNKLGTVWTQMKQPGRGLVHQREALRLQRSLGNGPGVVVALIQAAQSCLVLGQLDEARAYADEIETLGPQYPPADVEWLTAVPAQVAAKQGRWAQAKFLFRRTVVELERKRAQFRDAESQRRWALAKADFYGQAIEAALGADDADEAIVLLELARSRYLDAVMHARASRESDPLPAMSKWDADTARSELATHLTCLPTNAAVVWCGAFPSGLGVAAVWRDGERVVRRCAFHADIGSAELSALFAGSAGRLIEAQREGRAVDAIAAIVAEPHEPTYGADSFWQSRGEAWSDSLAEVVGCLRERVWPRLLDLVGAPVAQIVLLPSVGCSELPLSTAVPDGWRSGELLSASVAPSLAAILDRTGTVPGETPRLVQVDNPTEDDALACCVLEAAAVRPHFSEAATVLRGRRATPERVAAAFAQAEVVHFMGHASCDWTDPFDSALVCASRQDSPTRLRVRDMLEGTAPVAARLVVLSVCAIGYVVPGDKRNDFINLPSALVAAGAGCVLAPRWEVDDVAASMFVARWFGEWRERGQPPGAALAATRLWLRDEVTREVVERWLDANGVVGADAAHLQSIKDRYLAAYALRDRPFAHVVHWGAFELTGQVRPFGDAHA